MKHEDLPELERGFINLARHVETGRKFGVPVVVAINRFTADTEAENALLKSLCEKLEVESITADHWAKGGEGAVELAEAVVKTIETNPSQFRPLYDDNIPLWKDQKSVV